MLFTERTRGGMPPPDALTDDPVTTGPDAQAELERRLMALAQADPAGFAPLYQRYFARIYAYCRRRADSAQEAEDLASQVFVQALHGLAGYRGGSVAAWLFRIAHNVALNQRRARRAEVSLDAHDFDLEDEHPTPSESLDDAEARAAVRALVATLPDAQQNLLALKLVAGLTSEEIGAVLGKSPGAVRVELHRVIQRLRAACRQEDGGQS